MSKPCSNRTATGAVTVAVTGAITVAVIGAVTVAVTVSVTVAVAVTGRKRNSLNKRQI
jgi:hypothetical protein